MGKAKANEQPDLGRRGLFTGALLTKKGREAVKSQQARLQKPLGKTPPWHQQVMQIDSDACSLCDKQCIASCPQSIIRLHPEGHEYAGRPWLDFSANGCTLCASCADACPAIESFEKESSQLGSIWFAESNCLTRKGVLCMSCIGKCDNRALKLDERRSMLLDESLCTGCGMCVHTCPVNALLVKLDASSIETK